MDHIIDFSHALLVCLVAGYTAALVLLLALAIRKTRRERSDPLTGEPCCEHCGYLLIGLPEPRCPECGMPFRR